MRLSDFAASNLRRMAMLHVQDEKEAKGCCLDLSSVAGPRIELGTS